MSSSVRINLTINNSANTVAITCADISCETIPGMYVGQTIAAGKQASYDITTNDRVFCRFVDTNENVYEMGMTCPKTSHNSAEGCNGSEGLQKYSRTGTPVDFTYNIGSVNQADWDNGGPISNPNNSIVAYGDCSG